jgi:hypothetical protein
LANIFSPSVGVLFSLETIFFLHNKIRELENMSGCQGFKSMGMDGKRCPSRDNTRILVLMEMWLS